ncbi:hypothetical protein NLY44_28505 [Mesorhizobium sp. C089B]|nr:MULTISPECIES: hypothetical protein [unclassified Mesorhizobium]WJI54496.1 hypothetical protein NLY44_28505 [Mesorhizobium sp. C089B]
MRGYRAAQRQPQRRSDLSRCEHADLGGGHSVRLKRSAHLIRHRTGLRNLDFQACSWVCTVSALTARQVRTPLEAIVSISRAIPAPPLESDPTATSTCGSRLSATALSFDPFSRARFWGVVQRKVGDHGCAFRASLENAFETVRLMPPMETNGIGATWCFHSLMRSSPCDAHSSS